MNKFYLIFALCIFSATGNSQDLLDNVNNESTLQKQFSLGAISFPRDLNGEEYRQFELSYPISQKFNVQISGIYEKSILRELINPSLIFQLYFKEKLYLFSGIENEYESNIFTGGKYIRRTNFNFGVGYDINPDFLLELEYHQQFNKSQEEYFEFQGIKKGLLLRAKF